MLLTRNNTLRILETPEKVAEEGARIMLEEARERRHRTLKLRVALSGGSTPKGMYEVLRNVRGDDAALLRKFRYFFVDERSVPNDHPESNVRLAMEGFLRAQGIPSEQIYPPNGGAQVLTAEAWRLTLVLERCLPKAPETQTPQFDLIFLGMGPDGHTASLFPGTEALAALDDGYVMNEVPQLNTRRLTLTFPVLNAAKHLVIMITGDNKAGVLREIFSRGDARPVYPIEYLSADKMTWLIDKAAAKELPREILRKLQ